MRINWQKRLEIIDDNLINVTLLDANAATNLKLRKKSSPVKHQLCNISGDRLITEIIPRLRAGHYRGMKINWDGKTYRKCDNCSDTELTPALIFDCPAILAAVKKCGPVFVNKPTCE
ncbi:hypothetical protein TNCV_1778571 [Trichonephila clavipes]|nr:hypothetical protein TNCV_1778571 [Trichonephila clavipes]